MNPSHEFVLIQNLHNTAVWHHNHCSDENCGVSVTHLKEAAKLIRRLRELLGITQTEQLAIEHLFDNWPI